MTKLLTHRSLLFQIHSSVPKHNTVAVSVEGLTFIIIGHSWLEGCGFDSHYRPGSFLRFNSLAIMYSTVGSLASSGSIGPLTWVKLLLEPLDLMV